MVKRYRHLNLKTTSPDLRKRPKQLEERISTMAELIGAVGTS